jgi:XTP/dITP diphosphohydrolase
MSTEKKRMLLIATNNQGKLREFRSLLTGLDIEMLYLESFGNIAEIEETGLTFAANAELKATGYALQTGFTTLADDSGLEVEALNGRPGVMSARYAGPETSFQNKMAELLAELDRTSDTYRRARFVAAIAVADKTGALIHNAKGICPGRIASEPRGSGGFGYDPVFIPDGYDQTFGELPEVTKRKISHRGRAFSQIIPFLRGFFAI